MDIKREDLKKKKRNSRKHNPNSIVIIDTINLFLIVAIDIPMKNKVETNSATQSYAAEF